MQKKHADLVTIIFMSVFLVLSFMPIVFTNSYWKNDVPGVGSAKRAWSQGVNLYSRYLPLALLIALATAMCIVFSIMKLVGKKSNLIRFSNYVPFAAAILFGLISFKDFMTRVPNGDPGGTATLGYYGYYEYTPAWGFYIECALLIAVCVFSFLDMQGLLTGAVQGKAAEPKSDEKQTADAVMKTETANVEEKAVNKEAGAGDSAIDVIDELKRYKELLDSGVITQEEFEMKKKQLLGL